MTAGRSVSGGTMFKEAVTRLRRIQVRCDRYPEIKKMTDARDEIRRRYQSMFSLNNIPKLTAGDFQGFLRFENNQHWSSIHRYGARICQDMNALRRCLLALHDQLQPI